VKRRPPLRGRSSRLPLLFRIIFFVLILLFSCSLLESQSTNFPVRISHHIRTSLVPDRPMDAVSTCFFHFRLSFQSLRWEGQAAMHRAELIWSSRATDPGHAEPRRAQTDSRLAPKLLEVSPRPLRAASAIPPSGLSTVAAGHVCRFVIMSRARFQTCRSSFGTVEIGGLRVPMSRRVGNPS